MFILSFQVIRESVLTKTDYFILFSAGMLGFGLCLTIKPKNCGVGFGSHGLGLGLDT